MKNPRRKCEGGKIRYSDEMEARAHGMLYCENHAMKKVFVYRCPLCRGYHLTRRPKGRRRMVTADSAWHEPMVTV